MYLDAASTISKAFSLKRRWRTPCYESLSKLNWTGGLLFKSCGVVCGVRVNDLSLIPLLGARLPDHVKLMDPAARMPKLDCVLSVILGGRKSGSGVRAFHICYHNHTQVARSHSLEHALEAFDGMLNLSVATLSPRRVFVHAGAVSWKGRALLLPGPSLSGKSTLVAELVRRGAKYYSDDYAVLDDSGRVFPFPRPISMRATPTSKQMPLPVEAIGGVTATAPATVGLIAICQYKEGSEWRPTVLSQGGGVFGLLANAPAARVAPARVLRALQAVVARAPTIRSYRDDAETTALRLLRRLERS